MTYIKRLNTLIVAGALLMVTGLALGQSKTRLQVLVTSERQKADDVAQQLDKLGYGPAQVRPEGTLFKVLTRAYESSSEAALTKPYLKGAGFGDAWSVAEEGEQKPVSDATVFGATSIAPGLAVGALRIDLDKTPRTAAKAPITSELRALSDETADETQLMRKLSSFSDPVDADKAIASIDAFLKRFGNSKKLPAVKLQRAHWLLKKGDTTGASAEFDKVAREHADQIEGGDAELRGAYLAIRLKKPDADTLQRFEKIARGTVASTTQVRLEAMMRCAALYHRAKDLDTAQAAFLAVAKASSDPEVQAYAMMQTAAITLEKAWNSKATFAQARQQADDVVAQFAQVNKSTRATAALVALETLAYEKNYAQVLARESAYVRDYAGTPELQLAYYWFALAHLETGNVDAAKAIVQALLSAKFPTQERFNTVDVSISAQRLQKRIDEIQQAGAQQ